MATKLRTRTEKHQIPSVNSVAEPVSSLLASRPFVQAKTALGTVPSTTLQTSLSKAQHSGHSLSNIAVFSSSTVDTPITQRKRRRQSGEPNSPLTVQTSLEVGEPGDMYEQEADRTAAQVVDRIEQQSNSKPSSTQRKAATAGSLKIQPLVQTQAVSRPAKASAGIEQSIESHRGGGEALSGAIREPMEQQFGADFGAVRVHTDANSDTLNRSLNSQAFTTKNDIFFKKDAYNPSSRAGKELIAHELTHVVQQSGGSTIQRKTMDLPYIPMDMVREKRLNKIAGFISSRGADLFGATKTQEIQANIAQYNDLDITNSDFESQLNMVRQVKAWGVAWAAKYHPALKGKEQESADAPLPQVDQSGAKKGEQERFAEIWHIVETADEELGAVKGQQQEQSTNASGGLDEPRSRDRGLLEEKYKQSEDYRDAREGMNEIKENKDGLKETFGDFFKAVKGTAEKPEESGASGVSGFIEKVKSAIDQFGIKDLIMSIYKAYKSYKDLSIFEDAKKGAEGGGNDEMRKASEYAYKKVWRQFWTSAIPGAIRAFMKFIGRVLSAVTGGWSMLMDLGQSALGAVNTLYRKGKGLWKWMMGTRGANREKNAETIVNSALGGDRVAQMTMVRLELFGITDKLIMKAKTVLAEKTGFTMEGAYANVNELPGSDANEGNRLKLEQLLLNISRMPWRYGIDMKDVTERVSEKMKSFVG